LFTEIAPRLKTLKENYMDMNKHKDDTNKNLWIMMLITLLPLALIYFYFAKVVFAN